MIRIGLTLILCLFAQLSFAQGSVVEAVDIKADVGSYFVMVMTRKPIKYHIYIAHHPDRLVVDLPHSIMAKDAERPKPTAAPISHIQLLNHHPGKLRLVFHLLVPLAITQILQFDNWAYGSEILIKLGPKVTY